MSSEIHLTVKERSQQKNSVVYEFDCGCDAVVDSSDGYVFLCISCRLHMNYDRRTRLEATREAIDDYGLTGYPVCSVCRERHPSDDRHPCE